MDLMQIIGKAAAGEALSEAERGVLATYRPGDVDSAALERRNRELETRLEELEKSALTEPQQLKRRFETELTRLRENLKATGVERDAMKQELARVSSRRRIEHLAQEHGFVDTDYLEYLCCRDRIDPESQEVVEPFLKTLRENSPRFFKLNLTPGAPELPPSPVKSERNGGDILSLLAELPAENE